MSLGNRILWTEKSREEGEQRRTRRFGGRRGRTGLSGEDLIQRYLKLDSTAVENEENSYGWPL